MNTKGNKMAALNARDSLKTLVETLQETGEFGSTAFALGYIESLFAGVIESLPKTQQKRIVADIEHHIDYRKTA